MGCSFCLMIASALQADISLMHSVQNGGENNICAKVVDPTNSKLAVAYKNGIIEIWDIKSGNKCKQIQHVEADRGFYNYCSKDLCCCAPCETSDICSSCNPCDPCEYCPECEYCNPCDPCGAEYTYCTPCTPCDTISKDSIKLNVPIEAIAWHKEEPCLYVKMNFDNVYIWVKYDINSGYTYWIGADTTLEGLRDWCFSPNRNYAYYSGRVVKVSSPLVLPLFDVDYDYINKSWVESVCIEDQCVKQIDENYYDVVPSAWNPSGDYLFIAHENNLEVHDWTNDKVVHTFKHAGRIVNIKCAPNNKYVAVEYEYQNTRVVVLWDFILDKNVPLETSSSWSNSPFVICHAKNPTFDITGTKLFTEKESNGFDIWNIS